MTKQIAAFMLFMLFSLNINLSADENQTINVGIKGFMCKNLTSLKYMSDTSGVSDVDYISFDIKDVNNQHVVFSVISEDGKHELVASEKFLYNADSYVYAVYEIVEKDGVNQLKYIGFSMESNAERKKVKLNDVYYPAPLLKDCYTQNVTMGYVEGSALTEPLWFNKEKGLKAWDINKYDFMQGESPTTVHPTLWRMEQLNNINGIFQVLPVVEKGGTDGFIYQARSYNLATMSFVKSQNGWIIIDPMSSAESATAAWEAFKKNVDENAKITAILVTHSHIDHYNGIMGIIDPETIWEISQDEYIKLSKNPKKLAKVSEGKVLFVAPDGFYDEAISENLYVGTSMGRRALYMYGSLLPTDEYGHVGSGLGKSVPLTMTGELFEPSFELKCEKDGLKDLCIDGINLRFQNVPGTEAPAEFHIFIKEYNTLCPGENVTYTMHNLLTSRGAKVRDAKAFGKAIDDAMTIAEDYFDGNLEVLLGTHHWPTWGKDNCIEMMSKQRDMYYYFNNQVIHMLNKGMNMEEIAEVFTLPESLHSEYYNRGYYGTINHNVKAVVQRYVGWWDGNPANYYKYPEEEVAKRFVEDMGGEDAVLEKAQQYFMKEDYRWTVELTKQLVFNNPENKAARYLLADALEQLAYSFESGTWRNIFLSGAMDLRNGGISGLIPNSMKIKNAAKNMLNQSPEHIFEYYSILLDGDKAGKDNIDYSLDIKIADDCYNLHLVNGVLHYKKIEKSTESVKFANVEEFVNNFTKRMTMYKPDNAENVVTTTDYDPMDIFYRYFEIFDIGWNIIEPLE